MSKKWIPIVGVPMVIVGATAAFWFQPHKLFLDDRVDEAVPASAVTMPEVTIATAPPIDPSTASDANSESPSSGPIPTIPLTPRASTTPAGMFRSLEHTTSGKTILLQDAAGKKFVRFEDFTTSNGPDLVVILAKAPSTSTSWTVWGEDYVRLGRLKGNKGDQNYEIPASTDLNSYSNVVVWCDRFDVGFGVADLGPSRTSING